MPLVSGAIPNLINGVSQQPPSLRLPTQGDIQENGLSSVVRGLEKRPGTQHIAEVDSSFSDSSAFIHTIQRDEEEAYVAVLTDNSIKVFDLIGKYATYHDTNTTTAASGNQELRFYQAIESQMIPDLAYGTSGAKTLTFSSSIP